MKNIVNLTFISLIVLLVLTCGLIYFTNHAVLTVNFYNNSGDPFSETPANENEVYLALQKWIYISSLFYLLVKLGMIALLLHTSLYLAGHPLSFKQVFTITTLSEYIFFIPAVIKIIWFRHSYPNGSLTDWHRVYILSALTLFENAPADWYYALQTLNIFEAAYWFLLAFGIYRAAKLSYDHSLRIVLVSYLPALFIWVAVVTFSSLVLFPTTG